MNPFTDRLTFLFTDIEGSTRLWEQVPGIMAEALTRHDLLIRSAVLANNGTIFKTIGDAFCAAFSSPADAITAALAAQRAIVSESWPDQARIRVRIALHNGHVQVRDSDYFGPTLNRTSRLLATGYGGQILLSQSAVLQMAEVLPSGATLLSLGEHRLRDLTEPETVFQLEHADLPTQFPPLNSLGSTSLPNNLPLQISRFIGRESEMQEVRRLLSAARLVTILAMGGTGRTRLSLQVAADMLDEFTDGVWFVDLAGVTDEALIPQAIAAALEIAERPGQQYLATVQEALKSRRLLLILDNCEHLIGECAHIVDKLLRSCVKVTVLATSREALGISGERVYLLPPLPLPDIGAPANAESITQYAAVQLFVDRAIGVKGDFAVTDANAAALVGICQQLDGIPLAIELAAARVRSMTVEEIYRRLDARFRLLTGGSRASLPRQQTLRALIDWSWDLLEPRERRVLARLSVFAGGWCLEAAEAVCAEEGDAAIETVEVLDFLSALNDKSLMIAESRASGTRYRMLETVRYYAREKLQESGEMASVGLKHRDYYLALAEKAKPELDRSDQAMWLAILESEHDNLRQAIALSLHEPGGAKEALRLCGSLQQFWRTRGHPTEGLELTIAALALPDDAELSEARAAALFGAGTLATAVGNFERAEEYHSESLSIWRRLNDNGGVASALHGIGNAAHCLGHHSRAEARFSEALEIRRDLGDRWGVGITLNSVGLALFGMSRFREARNCIEESLSIARELSDAQGVASGLLNLAMVVYHEGEDVLARKQVEESLVILRELGDRYGIAMALNNLGSLVSDAGETREARRLYDEGLTIRRELRDVLGVASSLSNLGGLSLADSDHAAARSQFRESLSLYRELGHVGSVAMSLLNLANLAAIEGQYLDAARIWGGAEALRESADRAMTPRDEAEYRRHLDSARKRIDVEEFDLAWAEGRALSVDEIVSFALSVTSNPT